MMNLKDIIQFKICFLTVIIIIISHSSIYAQVNTGEEIVISSEHYLVVGADLRTDINGDGGIEDNDNIPEEDNPGKYIACNNDYDLDPTNEKDDLTWESGQKIRERFTKENEFCKVHMNLYSPDQAGDIINAKIKQGILKLERENANIRVWWKDDETHQYKRVLYTDLSEYWNLETDDPQREEWHSRDFFQYIKERLFVEGIKEGSCKLTLSYYKDYEAFEKKVDPGHSDSIMFNIVKVEFVNDSGNAITTQEIGKDPNFISDETLTIKYKIVPNILSASECSWEVVKDQITNSIKTDDPNNYNPDYANNQFSFKSQHAEEDPNAGSYNKTKGLKYKLKFKHKAIYFIDFIIEQDDINRARQESKIIHPNETVPDRTKYKGVKERLYKGTTTAHFRNRNMWLDQGIGAIDETIRGNNAYTDKVWYSCSWRSPYYNKTKSEYFTHPSGKAVDCRPEGKDQTKQNYHDQWDTIKEMGTTVLLEKGGKILRSKSKWYPLEPGDPSYSEIVSRTWEYKEDDQELELAYRYATHYHVANYP